MEDIQVPRPLKKNQEALDVLSSIPVKERDARTAMALAKLYHHYNNEKRSAVLCYKQVLSLDPLAVEAALGLLSLGVSLTEVLNATASATTNINSLPWLKGWLEAQACISKHDCKGAVVKLDTLSKAGFHLSADTSCQLAWCMEKLERKSASEELFATSVSLSPLHYSALHPEPWIAKVWHVIKSDHLPATEKVKAGVLATKACSLSHKNAEAKYLQASPRKSSQQNRLHAQPYEATRPFSARTLPLTGSGRSVMNPGQTQMTSSTSQQQQISSGASPNDLNRKTIAEALVDSDESIPVMDLGSHDYQKCRYLHWVIDTSTSIQEQLDDIIMSIFTHLNERCGTLLYHREQ